MKYMFRISLLVLVLLFAGTNHQVCAQGRTGGSSSGFTVKETSSSDNKPSKYGMWRFSNTHFLVGVRMERFLTDRYFQTQVGSKVGFEGSFTFEFFKPLELEVTPFRNKYYTPSPSISADDIVHRGVEFFLNAYVMPYIGKISNHFAPYVGVGYQTSRLEWGNSRASTSGAMLKFGLRVPFKKGFFLQGEYRQVIPSNSEKLFRVINVGLGINL